VGLHCGGRVLREDPGRAGCRCVHLNAALLVLSLSIGTAVFPAAAVAAPPPNDNFANAQVLSGSLPVVVTGTTTEATYESGEPLPPGEGCPSCVRSVWYRWTAPRGGDVLMETCAPAPSPQGSPFADVFTGSSPSNLQRVRLRSDIARTAECPYAEQPTRDTPYYQIYLFDAVAGQTYNIRVSGGEQFGLVLRKEEVYDLKLSQVLPRKTVPVGGTVKMKLKVTNRGNIPAPTGERQRLAFGQAINRPGAPNSPGKGTYLFVRGFKCSKGFFGRVPSFACIVKRLAPGESQIAVAKIRVKQSILLDADFGPFSDDRRGNNSANAVVRVTGRGGR
jgi:hypothetical protein